MLVLADLSIWLPAQGLARSGFSIMVRSIATETRLHIFNSQLDHSIA